MMPFIVTCIVVLLLVIGSCVERRVMRHYWQRACTGKLWRQRFPLASKPEIREFLDIFLEAFGFPEARRLCFAPDDRVIDVYRTLYPRPCRSDSMELESLVGDLEERYRVGIPGSWHNEITLGDLFRMTRQT